MTKLSVHNKPSFILLVRMAYVRNTGDDDQSRISYSGNGIQDAGYHVVIGSPGCDRFISSQQHVEILRSITHNPETGKHRF